MLTRSILDHRLKILFDNDTDTRFLDPATLQGIAQQHLATWLSLSARKTRSREERESFIRDVPHPNDREGFSQQFGSCSFINAVCVVSCKLGFFSLDGSKINTELK